MGASLLARQWTVEINVAPAKLACQGRVAGADALRPATRRMPVFAPRMASDLQTKT
jgi:hypothetical protein